MSSSSGHRGSYIHNLLIMRPVYNDGIDSCISYKFSLTCSALSLSTVSVTARVRPFPGTGLPMGKVGQ